MFGRWLNNTNADALRALRMLDAVRELSADAGESVEIYATHIRVCGSWTGWTTIKYVDYPDVYHALMAAQRDRQNSLRRR